MTDHLHATIVPGCYRCELGADEAAADAAEALSPTAVAIRAIRAAEREQVALEILEDRPNHAASCRCGGCTRLRKDVAIARRAIS